MERREWDIKNDSRVSGNWIGGRWSSFVGQGVCIVEMLTY